ncbi:MAG: HAMP domain-containing sensor histidine kinase [Tepidiformaceae bacterium]
MAHELRTPMTVILGNASLLATRRRELSDAESNGAVADIEVELDRLNSTMNDLVTLARFDHGLILEREPLAIGALVDRVTEAFIGASKRSVSIMGTCEAVVEGDELCLEGLLKNLLNNANKYSPPNSLIEVTIEALPGECRIAVLDRGIGIPPDIGEELFHAFFRSERVRGSIRGLGLGLTLAKKVVEGHEGRIWAEPRVGGGSQFVFALPTVSHG